MKRLAAFLLVLLAPGRLPAFEDRPELRPYARLDAKAVSECSALLKSPAHKNVYWALNDSGHIPALYAFTRDGRPVRPEAGKNGDYRGIRISSAPNVDWETLTADDKGNLIIGDIGNNRSRRRNLAVYFLPEPDPNQAAAVQAVKKIMFRYPDQKEFPPKRADFDAESLFWASGRLYLVTKHRSDTRAKLYRFDSLEPGAVNTLTPVSSFDVKAMATDAAVTPDGKLLALLTYDGAWLFEKPAGSDDYFAGKKRRFAFGAGQCEGITFDGPDTLVITNEDRELFELKVSSFTRE